MATKSHHVVPSPQGGWSVVKAGAARASKRFETQAAAVDWARELSKKQGSTLFVHRRDGTIARKDSGV
ncbi:MAG: hypothetical protein BWY06_00924 [Candidatus Latescibacteria bacterium ADurb.Bin168]|nr:MAG: hypothetical protein BWY06_00924 [Candidatus Latescibacteria bacterium ADurb.Bin168]